VALLGGIMELKVTGNIIPTSELRIKQAGLMAELNLINLELSRRAGTLLQPSSDKVAHHQV